MTDSVTQEIQVSGLFARRALREGGSVAREENDATA